MKKNGNYTVVLHPTEWGGNKKGGEKKFFDFFEKYHNEVVSFDVLLGQKTGNFVLQKSDEFFYLLYARKIRKLLLKLYSIVFKRM